MAPRRIVRNAALLPATLVAVGFAVSPLSGQTLERAQTVGVERTARGWLGLSLREVLSPSGAPGSIQGIRLVVTDLFQGGPADLGGLRPGDVLVRMNGAPAEIRRFRSLADRLLPGDPLALSVVRDGRLIELSLEAGVAPGRDELVRQIVQVHLDSARVAFAPRLDSLKTVLGRFEVRESPFFGAAPEVQVATVDGDTLRTYVVVTRPDGGRMTLAEMPRGTVQGTARVTASGPLRPLERPSVVRLREVEDSVRRQAEAEWSEWRLRTPYVTGANRVAGAAFRAVDAGLGSYFGVERGVLVLEVAEGTPARSAGLEAGDVIVRAQGQVVAEVEAFRTLLARSIGAVELTVVRRGRTLSLLLPR